VGAAEIVPTYGPNDGKEIAPGVHIVEIGKWDFEKTGIKSILVLDAVFQPGAADKESVMDNDMVCFITSGEFTIKKTNPDKEFNVKKGDYYTCSKGKTDHATNISKEVGIHRITVLIPA
jgi:hypothetical protein